jgi:hypothetical protein
MFSAHEMRQFAAESIEAAEKARTDELRKHHLDMAKMWTKVAAQMDGGRVIPLFPGEEARE